MDWPTYPYKKIGAAVSGGADSMVMLDLLLKGPCSVTVINVDHGIRGENSERDSAFVAGYCRERGVKCLLYKVDAPDFAEREGVSVELAARILRYDVFDGLLSYGTFEAVALAHHMDDRAETVLMRLFRGTGVRGMRGITDRNGFIHPLLNHTKKEILKYAKEQNIPYIQDETNSDSKYTRNFIRNELLPLVETRFPAARETIARTAENMEEVEDFLLSEATKTYKENGVLFLPLSTLSRHPAIAKKSVAEALREAGILQDAEETHLNSILNLRNLPNNSVINLPFGMDVIREYDRLSFTVRKPRIKFREPFSLDAEYVFGGLRYSFKKADKISEGVFDATKIPEGAIVRTREDGDIFKRLGGGSKPFNEYLSDVKIPMRERNFVLVIARDKKILAAAGRSVTAVSADLKVDEGCGNIYRITKSEA
jgi:tRNA(Ile)-lysidine synthetase, N-terminal domain